MLTLTFPVTRCTSHDTDLPSKSNISKMVSQVDRFSTRNSLVIDI